MCDLDSLLGSEAAVDSEHVYSAARLRTQLSALLQQDTGSELVDPDQPEHMVCPFSADTSQQLFALLSGSPQALFAAAALKGLQYEHVPSLLAYCGHVLQAERVWGGGVEDSRERDAAAAEWLGALLDGHFVQLALDPGSPALLLRLQQVLEERTQQSQELSRLTALLRGLRAHPGSSLTHARTIGSYCIQTLTF